LFKTQKTFQRVTPDVSVRPTSDISPVNWNEASTGLVEFHQHKAYRQMERNY
jgi:hypothetical protein